ncbi:hypothetical protein GE09DRAFT_393345 [Coniochaeta sp. 2T2.1]|nr:hypothetical protein GE09DRAFT_393345 [Coniochaeta sp. 2T2.1]
MAEALLMIFSLAFMPSDHPKPASSHHHRHHHYHAKSKTSTKAQHTDCVYNPQKKEHHLPKKAAKRAARALRHKVGSLGHKMDSRLYKGPEQEDTINTRQEADLRKDRPQGPTHPRHPTSRSPRRQTDPTVPRFKDTANDQQSVHRTPDQLTSSRDRISSPTLSNSGHQQRQRSEQLPTTPALGTRPRLTTRGQDWFEDLDVTGPSLYDDMFYGNCHT